MFLHFGLDFLAPIVTFQEKQDWTHTQMTEEELMQIKGLLYIEVLQARMQAGRQVAGNRLAGRFWLTETQKQKYNTARQ